MSPRLFEQVASTRPRACDHLRPFACPSPGCSQRFKRKSTLFEHIKTHTGEKLYPCPVTNCGASFTTSGNLARHKRLHPWLQPQTCFVDGCGREFSNEDKYERHVMKHFLPRYSRETCPIPGCGKTFATWGNVARHIKQAHAVVMRRQDTIDTEIEDEISSVLSLYTDVDLEKSHNY